MSIHVTSVVAIVYMNRGRKAILSFAATTTKQHLFKFKKLYKSFLPMFFLH